MTDLHRFVSAQEAVHGGFVTALRELERGRKTSHWIWYVFPQLAGLGRSPTAVRYGLAGPEEAADYLRDGVLGERLVAAAAAARSHVEGSPRASLEALMGSPIDALKLVSCVTLFRHVARELDAAEPHPRYAAMAEHAERILAAAAAQGYGPCAFTERELRRPRP